MIPKGEYKIISANGHEVTVHKKPTFDDLYRQLDCKDTGISDIILTHDTSGLPQTVMIIDDMGRLKNKPVNERATNLMRQCYGHDVPYKIHGDVALVNDSDFDKTSKDIADEICEEGIGRKH